MPVIKATTDGETVQMSHEDWTRVCGNIAELEADRRRVAERLRYLADSAPPEELDGELYALARSLE